MRAADGSFLYSTRDGAAYVVAVGTPNALQERWVYRETERTAAAHKFRTLRAAYHPSVVNDRAKLTA